MTLHELHSVLVNISILEISMFIIGLLFFMKMMSRMGNFWLFLPHLARGILGFTLLKKLPNSHEVVKELHFEHVSGKVGFEKAQEKLKQDASRVFMGYYRVLHKLFKVYLVLTIVTGLFDFINFIVVVRFFAERGYEYEEMAMLIFTIIFW